MKGKLIGEFFILRKKFKKLFKKIKQDQNEIILDLGCGQKPYYHSLIKGKVVSLDISKSNTTDVLADSHLLPFKEKKFDKIYCINSFYYFSNPFKVLNEIGLLLKKNGKLVMTMPFIYPIHDAPVDKYRFTEYGIKNLLNEDYKIDLIKPVGGIFTLISVIFHSLIKGMPILFILYPLYWLSQLFSLLDFLDFTRRWPTYYFVIASKK